MCRQRKTLKIRQVWALSKSWQPVCDSSCHFYPLTYASEHKKALIFSNSPKVTSPAPSSCVEGWQCQRTPPCLPSFPLTQSEKVHSHLYLQGSCFFFKEQHDQHCGIWKTRSTTGKNKSVRKCEAFAMLTPTARLEAHKKCLRHSVLSLSLHLCSRLSPWTRFPMKQV